MSDQKRPQDKELTNDQLDTATGGFPMGPRGSHGIEGEVLVGHRRQEQIRNGGGHQRDTE